MGLNSLTISNIIMKIYIHENLSNIYLDNLKNLEKYLVKTVSVKDIYSCSGLFKIENNKKLSQIIIHDGDIYKYDNYINNLSMILDKSIVKKIDRDPSHISNNHDTVDYIQNYYSFQEKSPLYLVIELYKNKELKDVFFRFENTYAAYSDADINSPFIKEDIEKFLQFI
tara:strand:+ start:3995 stop:4501 length:507 start_codon:yes stop_codon:yes gene_type:complete